jgi:hypothetical protein
MKKLIFLFTFMASLFTSLNTDAQCYTATYGLWPSSTFTPTCNNTFANVTTSGYAGEYSNVNLIAGNTYTFRSSVTTDYITVDNNGAAPLVGVVGVGGLNGLTWVCTATGTYRFYTHTNAACGSSSSLRTRSMRCTGSTPPPPPAPSTNCTNTTAFGSATINSTGTLVTISTCSYAGEYSTISGAVSGQVLRFTSSATGDYITIRSGSFNGPVVAQGASPLQFTNTFNGTLYAHWNTANGCGTQSSCRTTTVQCMSCTAPPAVANDNCSGATLLSCGGSVTVNTTAANTDAAGSNFCGTTISTPGVWYTIAGNGQDMTVSTVGLTSVDTKIMVFSGSCAGLTCVGGSDDFSGLQSQVSWSSVSGTTYYVLAATFSGTGSFPMSLTCVAPPPPYNACNNISNIAACGTTTNVNITAGNGSWDGYGSPFSTPGRENLFTFTPAITASYPITVTNNGSGWIDLFVKASASGCNNSGWTYIDDISGTVTNNVTLTAGVTYYFLLDDEDANGSTGSISIGCPCIGSAVDGTFTYSAPFSISGTTAGGCDDSPLRAGSDRIYAVNVGCAGSYTFSLCGGATWDTYLYLTTAAGGGGTIVAFNDDACSLQSSMTATLAAGTYYVVVEGFSSTSEGAFTLNVSGTGSTPSITGSATDATCNGSSNGSITATVNGNGNTATATLNGNAFNGSASGLAAGTYTLVATNCWGTSSQTFTVGQPAALSAVVTSNVANNEVCVGGDMTLSGSIGGNVIVSYRWESYDDFFGWSPLTSDVNVAAPSTVTYDLTGLSTSGSYQLVVTSAADGSCTASGDILVTVVEDPTLSISSTNVSCNGGNNGTAVADLSGGVAGMQYAYEWNDGMLNLSSSNAVSGLSAGTFYVSATGTLGCDASASVDITQPDVLVASTSTSDFNGYGVSCNGGSNGEVVVSATGGTAPYSGTGNNAGLSAGSYNYTVTDANGCTASASATITEPTVLTVGVVASNYNGYGVSCFQSTDGSADATANGGVAGYSYSWDNGSSSEDLSGLGAGSYSVTVTDANGCTATDGVVLVEPTKVNISATNTAILCNGQTSDVTVLTSGGVTPYSVDDAGSYTVPAGSYTYDVVDANGCSASTTIDITQPAVLTIDAGSDETVFFGYGPMSCADLNATVNGGTPAYSVSWTSTASGGGIGTSLTACPTSNESYTVSVVDANGCTASDQLSICVVDVTCYAGNSSIQKVQMCQVPPGNPANAHTICIDASAVPAHLAIGCQLGECGELAAACAAPAAKNMEADVLAAALVAYPNPTANTTTVSVTLTKAGNYSVAMYDMMGKLVKTVYAGSFEDYENLEFDVDMTNLNTGVYMISVSNGDQKIENIRVMKNL